MAIHGLRKFLDRTYQRLLGVLHGVHRIITQLNLAVSELSDFTIVCTSNQDLELQIWPFFLKLSAEFHNLGNVQAIDATGMDRIATSQHYAKRTNYTFEVVKTTLLYGQGTD